MATEELLVIDRLYELIRWFMPHVAKFPRNHRYTLGARIENTLFSIMEGLIRAKYGDSKVKLDVLPTVNIELEILRMHVRLAHEMAALPHKSHEFAIREMNEIGKMVGGWIRQQSRR